MRGRCAADSVEVTSQHIMSTTAFDAVDGSLPSGLNGNRTLAPRYLWWEPSTA